MTGLVGAKRVTSWEQNQANSMRAAAQMGAEPRIARKGPFLYVQAKVLRRNSPYSSHARLVALALAMHLNRVRDQFARYSAWPSHQTLAKESGYSVSTVQRALNELCDGPDSLFLRDTRIKSVTRNGKTLNFKSTYFALVLGNPAAFVAGRDAARARREAADAQQLREAAQTYHERRQPIVAAQMRDRISSEECDRRLRDLEREMKATLPARLRRKWPRPSQPVTELAS